MITTYDALLLVSFGGPDRSDDVVPFLHNVTQGRGVPAARLQEVAARYERFGGVSPINAENRDLLAAIRQELALHDISLPVFWGNRNWHPYLADALREMATDGIGRALAFVTSAYASYSGCRQYQEDIEHARTMVGRSAPTVAKLRHYFNHPGFVAANTDSVRAAIAAIPAQRWSSTRLLFTAHSIPMSMARESGPSGDAYVRQHTEAARLVAEAFPGMGWELVWQSRSGPPSVPWLEPDVNARLAQLPGEGVTDVVVSPIGFVSDHFEVVWDLDIEASAAAARLGLGFSRASTAGRDPRFVTMVRELVQERISASVPRRALGTLGPSHDCCPAGCCLPAP